MTTPEVSDSECQWDCPACCHYDECYVDEDDEPRCPYLEASQ